MESSMLTPEEIQRHKDRFAKVLDDDVNTLQEMHQRAYPNGANSDLPVHPLLGISSALKQEIERFHCSGTTLADIMGCVAARVTPKNTQAAKFDGDSGFLAYGSRLVDEQGNISDTPIPSSHQALMKAHSQLAGFLRTNTDQLKEPVGANVTHTLAASLFVTLCDVRGLVVMPSNILPTTLDVEYAHMDLDDDDEKNTTTGAPSIAKKAPRATDLRTLLPVPSSRWASEYVPGANLAPFIAKIEKTGKPQRLERLCRLSPANWTAKNWPMDNVRSLIIWAVPQSLSVDPYPIGYIPIMATSEQPAAFFIRFQHIAKAAWEQAVFMAFNSDAFQTSATLVQLSTHIHIANYLEQTLGPRLPGYFNGRAFLSNQMLVVRRLLWLQNLGMFTSDTGGGNDPVNPANNPTDTLPPITTGISELLELVVNSAWLYPTDEAFVPERYNFLKQWRVYKCMHLAALVGIKAQEWRAELSFTSRFLSMMPNREGSIYFSELGTCLSPFQLDLFHYAHIFFRFPKQLAGAFSNFDVYQTCLGEVASSLLLWTDATMLESASLYTFPNTNQATHQKHEALITSWLRELFSVSTDAEPAPTVLPPYTTGTLPRWIVGENLAANRVVLKQKRWLIIMMNRLQELHLDLPTYFAKGNLVQGADRPIIPYGSDTRFLDDWSTLYSNVSPRTISPLVTRPQRSAQAYDPGHLMRKALQQKFDAAYKQQESRLIWRRRLQPGGASKDRPSLYHPSNHPLPRMRFLYAYVRYLWYRRSNQYDRLGQATKNNKNAAADEEEEEEEEGAERDTGNLPEEAQRSWSDFMAEMNRAMPHLRQLHTLAVSLPEERFFELTMDLLYQATPIPRPPNKRNTEAAGEELLKHLNLDKYELIDPYRRLLNWLTRANVADTADDPPLTPVSVETLVSILNNRLVDPTSQMPYNIYNKGQLDYDRPKQVLTVERVQPRLLRTYQTPDEAFSTFVRTPERSGFKPGETQRSINLNPTHNPSVATGLNRARVLLPNQHGSSIYGYDMPALGHAMEDALIYKKLSGQNDKHAWQPRTRNEGSNQDPVNFDVCPLSWAEQHRLTELALIKFQHIYLDTLDALQEPPFAWNPILVNRSTLHAFRHFLAHNFLSSDDVLAAGMRLANDVQRADYIQATLRHLVWASLVYGSTRSHNTMQNLLHDATGLALLWCQTAEEVAEFARGALGSAACTRTLVAIPWDSNDLESILHACGREIRLGSSVPARHIEAFAKKLCDTFLATDASLDPALKQAMYNGLLADMHANATLVPIQFAHMVETVVYRQSAGTIPSLTDVDTVSSVTYRAAQCGWSFIDHPPALLGVAPGWFLHAASPLVVDASIVVKGRAKKRLGRKATTTKKTVVVNTEPVTLTDLLPAVQEKREKDVKEEPLFKAANNTKTIRKRVTKRKRGELDEDDNNVLPLDDAPMAILSRNAGAATAELQRMVTSANQGAVVSRDPSDLEMFDDLTSLLMTANTQPRSLAPRQQQQQQQTDTLLPLKKKARTRVDPPIEKEKKAVEQVKMRSPFDEVEEEMQQEMGIIPRFADSTPEEEEAQLSFSGVRQTTMSALMDTLLQYNEHKPAK